MSERMTDVEFEAEIALQSTGRYGSHGRRMAERVRELQLALSSAHAEIERLRAEVALHKRGAQAALDVLNDIGAARKESP